MATGILVTGILVGMGRAQGPIQKFIYPKTPYHPKPTDTQRN